MTPIQRAAFKPGFATLCLRESLIEALVALAAHHGGKAGPWLDDLETSFVGGAKGSIASPNVPHELEADAATFAIDTIRRAVAEVRAKLA